MKWPKGQEVQGVPAWPGGHSTQRSTLAMVPLGQRKHSALPTIETELPEQGAQVLDPAEGATVPATQGVQVVEPAEGAAVPSGQEVQSCEPENSANLPAGHSAQGTSPGEKRPGLQVTQSIELLEKAPIPHE